MTLSPIYFGSTMTSSSPSQLTLTLLRLEHVGHVSPPSALHPAQSGVVICVWFVTVGRPGGEFVKPAEILIFA